MSILPPPRNSRRAPEPSPSGLFPAHEEPPPRLSPPSPQPPPASPSQLPPPPPAALVANYFAPPSAPLDEPTISMEPVIDLREGVATAAAGPDAKPGTLIARDVSAWFGARKVLERCSLDMAAGRVTALIGPSGCGKSTFLRILNRMHEVVPGAQMGGLVALDGADIYGDELNPTEVRLRIGMVFQKPNPFPAMSIGENVLAGLKLSGTRTADAAELTEVSLRRAGLWNEVKDRLDQGGAALSGGQQQRLCIARALAVKPRVLLMDEPCSALDPISTRVIEETIKELAHEITIVIVTHNMQQAQRVSDECAFFLVEEQGKPGRLIESGRTVDLFGNPRDARTGDYVSGRFG